jgi:hypothetical protein
VERDGAQIYSIGELNQLIDAFVHPLAKREPWFLVVDGFLHAIVERNPPESVLKFMRYGLPDLINYRKRHRK